MKKTRLTEEQMVTSLREADQRPVPEVTKTHCVSAQLITIGDMGGNIGDLNQLKDASHTAGLGYGYILISNNADSYNDIDWYNGVMNQTASYSHVAADLYLLSSWLHTPRT